MSEQSDNQADHEEPMILENVENIDLIAKQVVDNVIQQIEDEPAKPRLEKKLTFTNVDLYLFNRTQGFECIPSDSAKGTITLGMSQKHIHLETFENIDAYLIKKRSDHLFRLEEEKTKILKRRNEIENIINSNNFFKPKQTHALPTNVLLPDYTEEEAEKILKVVSNRSEYENISTELPVSTDLFSPILAPEERYAKLLDDGFSESEIDKSESKEILHIQESREVVGCRCGLYGLSCAENKNCSCWSNGIGCQVDKQQYPCCCSVKKCKNEFGLKRFDHRSVIEHWNKTLGKPSVPEAIPAKPVIKRKRKRNIINRRKKRKVN